MTFYYGCGSYIRKGRSVCRFGPVGQKDLEEAVIDAVVAHYQSYLDEQGRKRMARGVQAFIGSETEDSTRARHRAEQERGEIQHSIDNLLDNITPSNREFVDQRLEELGKRREELDQRLETLEHLSLTSVEVNSIVEETEAFLQDLESRLRCGSPDKRIQAIRRCVDRAEFDWESGMATLQLWTVPSTALQSDGVERVSVEIEIEKGKSAGAEGQE